MFLALREFRVKSGCDERLKSAYRPDGDYAQLFRRDVVKQQTLSWRNTFRHRLAISGNPGKRTNHFGKTIHRLTLRPTKSPISSPMPGEGFVDSSSSRMTAETRRWLFAFSLNASPLATQPRISSWPTDQRGHRASSHAAETVVAFQPSAKPLPQQDSRCEPRLPSWRASLLRSSHRRGTNHRC